LQDLATSYVEAILEYIAVTILILKTVTVMYAETLEHLQYMMLLNPKADVTH
jgi:hypothetical protein